MTSKKKITKKKKAIKKKTNLSFGKQMISDLTTFHDAISSGEKLGEKFTIHTVALSLEPRAYTPEMVRETRDRLNASQAVFAKVLAVSLKTVQAWERGDSTPSPSCRRLLDLVSANSLAWIEILKQSLRDETFNRSA